jgi:hypothetical protein
MVRSEMATTFTQNIKPYFSDCYRENMTFLFDLWSADDVKTNWQDIYDSVKSERMPIAGCPEGVWDAERRQQFLTDFTHWKAEGYQP